MSDSKDSDVSITLPSKEMDLAKNAKTLFNSVKTFLFNNVQILVPLLTCIFTWACLYWLIPKGGGYIFDGQDMFLMVWLAAFLSFSMSAKEWAHQRKTRGCYKLYFFVTTTFIVVSLIFAIYLFVRACDTLMAPYRNNNSQEFTKYLFGFVFVILMICALIHYGLKSVWIEKKKEEEKKQHDEQVKNLVNKQLMSIKEDEGKDKQTEVLIKFNTKDERKTEKNRVINSEFLMHFLSFFVISAFFVLVLSPAYIEYAEAKGLLFLCAISSTWNFSIALMTKGRKEKFLKLYWPYFLMTLFPIIFTGIVMFWVTVGSILDGVHYIQRYSTVKFSSFFWETACYVFLCVVISYPMFFLLVKYGVVVIGHNFWKMVKGEKKGVLSVI